MTAEIAEALIAYEYLMEWGSPLRSNDVDFFVYEDGDKFVAHIAYVKSYNLVSPATHLTPAEYEEVLCHEEKAFKHTPDYAWVHDVSTWINTLDF
jgi:hypothetical protein